MDSEQEEEQFDHDEYEQNHNQIEEFEAKLNRRNSNSSDEYQGYERKTQLPSIQPQNKIEAIQKQLQFAKQQQPQTIQEECEEIINSKNESLKDKKLRELAQRNKMLQVKYEKEKLAKSKLEEQLKKALADTQDQIKAIDKALPKPAQPKQDPLLKSLKVPEKEENVPEDFKSKFKEADKKVQEQRVKIQQLKTDLNKAFRVIQREIGVETVNLDQLILDENSWKARAQQIEILKGKVRDLTQKLCQSSQMSENSMSSKSKDLNSTTKSSAQLDLMKQQVDQLRAENEQLQQKVKAVSSRRQILEDQIKDVKSEYEKNKKILLEKSDNDDRYIQALKLELERTKKQMPAQETKIIYKPSDNDDSKKLKQELKHCKDQIERNEKIIKELIAEKVQKQNIQQPPIQKMNDDKVLKLEQEIQLLKQEKDEYFKKLSKDQDTQQMLKDLTQQNVKLRNKVDDLSKKKK